MGRCFRRNDNVGFQASSSQNSMSSHHCELSEAPTVPQSKCGLLHGACQRARIRATRWLAMTPKHTSAISRLDMPEVYQKSVAAR